MGDVSSWMMGDDIFWGGVVTAVKVAALCGASREGLHLLAKIESHNFFSALNQTNGLRYDSRRVFV